VDSLPINPADLVVIAIIIVSGLLALARGLVREVLSIVGWVGAAIITLFSIPYVKPYVAPLINQDEFVVNVVTGVLIFVVTLIAISLASYGIARQVKDSHLSALDRSLGFVFGVVRGMVLVCLAYMVIAWALPEPDHPRALREARTLPFIQMGVNLLTGLVPDSWRSNGTKRTEEQRRKDEAEEARRNAAKVLETLVAPQPKAPAPRETQGYKPDERRDMERLIQGTKGQAPKGTTQ
jgi:membrane protein required for colicin V production